MASEKQQQRAVDDFARGVRTPQVVEATRKVATHRDDSLGVRARKLLRDNGFSY